MEITIVFSEPEQIANFDYPSNHEFIFLDENSAKTRKKAFQNKGTIAARLTPCCIVRDNNKVIKAFYKEASKNPILDCLNWLNN